MASVYDVANWFLSKDSIQPKKLQKLCYYYEAWHNALYDDSGIDDTQFQAWVHGPVSPELYREYKRFGWNPIPKKTDIINSLGEKQLELLESVWLTYGDLSGNELEALTHDEMPWKIARGSCSSTEKCTNVISPESMATFYKSIYIGD